jgi:hypothetical protein
MLTFIDSFNVLHYYGHYLDNHQNQGNQLLINVLLLVQVVW